MKEVELAAYDLYFYYSTVEDLEKSHFSSISKELRKDEFFQLPIA